MTSAELLTETQRLGITLAVKGDRLHITAPKGSLTSGIREALTQHKAELLQVLTSPERSPPSTVADRYPPDELGEPCPNCGSKEKWIWYGERRLCRSCVIQGGHPPAAVDQQHRA